jgi:hypothetical protein
LPRQPPLKSTAGSIHGAKYRAPNASYLHTKRHASHATSLPHRRPPSAASIARIKLSWSPSKTNPFLSCFLFYFYLFRDNLREKGKEGAGQNAAIWRGQVEQGDTAVALLHV